MKLPLFSFLLTFFSATTFAQTTSSWLNPFVDLYKQELGTAIACQQTSSTEMRVCSTALRNDGNSPFILHHGKPTEKTVVLFHGLSDSPFFFDSIAKAIHAQGYTVVVALLPGHGKIDADADMEDSDLDKRWGQHVESIMNFAYSVSDKVYMGGFSTGGALAVQYIVTHEQPVSGLLLFSGAMALDESVESFGRVWGVGLIAKLMDGTYQTDGPNPFKYPTVARYSALKLVDVIFDIREQFEKGNLPNLPIFSAHSMADNTTPWSGIEMLLEKNQGPHSTFILSKELDVCHADVVVNQRQIDEIHYDMSKAGKISKCSVPKANPQHEIMLAAMLTFLSQH